MTKEEEIIEKYPEVMLMDGFDDCIIGICLRFGQEPIVAYDLDKVFKTLMNDGMSYEEAVEYWEFNQIGAWIGKTTPCFIEK